VSRVAAELVSMPPRHSGQDIRLQRVRAFSGALPPPSPAPAGTRGPHEGTPFKVDVGPAGAQDLQLWLPGLSFAPVAEASAAPGASSDSAVSGSDPGTECIEPLSPHTAETLTRARLGQWAAAAARGGRAGAEAGGQHQLQHLTRPGAA